MGELVINRKAEMRRLKAILNAPVAKMLPTLTDHIAYDTDLTPLQAKRILKAAAKEIAAKTEKD